MLHLEQLTNIEEVIEAYGNYVNAMKKDVHMYLILNVLWV